MRRNINIDNDPKVRLIGIIKHDRFNEIRAVLRSAVANNRDVTVDLSKVTEIDGSGLACLVQAFQMARHCGVEFRLGKMSVKAKKIVQISRLDSIIPINDS